MIQSRLSVKTDFPSDIGTNPYTININGQYEWVDNYLKFGDLIEEHMGKEARDFYFETLYSLLDSREAEDEEEEEPVVQKEQPNGRKQRNLEGHKGLRRIVPSVKYGEN